MPLQSFSVLAVHRHWWTKEIKDHDSRKENTILVCRTTDSNEHRNGSLSGVHHTKRGKRSSDIYWAGISACRFYLRTWLLHRQVEETNRESLTRSSFCFHCWKERKSETAFPPFLDTLYNLSSIGFILWCFCTFLTFLQIADGISKVILRLCAKIRFPNDFRNSWCHFSSDFYIFLCLFPDEIRLLPEWTSLPLLDDL